jgi:molybdate transport system substrate-binding protein
MQEIVEEFKQQHPKESIEVTYSATGKAYAQLLNGLSYDIFMAADSLYPQKIAEDGNALGEAKVYALADLHFTHTMQIFSKMV